MCLCVVSLSSWEKRRYYIMRRNSLLNDALYVDEDYFSGTSFSVLQTCFVHILLFTTNCSLHIFRFSKFSPHRSLTLSLSLFITKFPTFRLLCNLRAHNKASPKPATAGPLYFYIHAMPCLPMHSFGPPGSESRIIKLQVQTYTNDDGAQLLCARLQPLLLHQIQPSDNRAEKVQRAFPFAAQRVGRGCQATGWAKHGMQKI